MKTLGLAVSFALTLCAADAPVVHRQPSAAGVFPQGARPGDTVDAEVLGEHLDRAARIVFTDSEIRAEISEVSPLRLKLRIGVSSSASYGPHYFRVITPRGASGPVLFRVGDLPRAAEKEPNSTIAEAMPVPTPVTIDGRLNTDGDFDFYRFPAKAGQRWLFDLRAARNGNGLDAALILLDRIGRKLAHSEDHFIWDPFVDFTFGEDGEYVAVVQPTHRNNDPNFAYELDIRQAPHLETVSPLSFMPGSSAEATIYGAALVGEQARLLFDDPRITGSVGALRGSNAQLRIEVPAETRQGVHELVLLSRAGRSNPVRFLVDRTPQHHSGRDLTPPVSINGVARYREPERFSVTAKKGETLVFEVRAGRFGSPVDSNLRLLDEAGKTVASNDDFPFLAADFYNRDSRLSHTFAQDGRYTLELRNLVATDGENYPYQLLITPPRPGFELELANERLYIYPGKEAKLKVTAKRLDGHKAAIPLSLHGLPAGITAEPAEIGEGKNEAEISLKAAAGLPPGACARLAIVSGGERAWRPVRIAGGGGEGAAFARMEDAMLVVAEKPLFSLEAAVTTLSLPRGASAMVPVMIRREEGFTAPIEFRLENLPPGVAMEPVTAAEGQSRAEIRLRASADARLGRAPRVAISGTAGGQTQQAPRIGISVD
jgi:hypothetical protein